MLLRDEPNHVGGLGYLEKIVGVSDGVGFFSFNPAKAVYDERCDQGWWGPESFHQQTPEGACSCGNIDNDKATAKVCADGVMTIDDLVFACSFYSNPPVGYIVYNEMKDPEVEEALCRNHWTSQERTLQELLKLMLEWKDCFTEMGDVSLIAVTASELIDSMNMPVSVEEWIRSNVPEGAVARYLRGDTNARERSGNVPDLPDFVSAWLREIVDEGMAFGQGNSKAKRISN